MRLEERGIDNRVSRSRREEYSKKGRTDECWKIRANRTFGIDIFNRTKPVSASVILLLTNTHTTKSWIN